MRNLLALLLFVPCTLLSQLPDYVPEAGLQMWFSFDGDYEDQSINQVGHSISGTIPFAADRFGTESSALQFNGNASNFLNLNYGPSLTFSDGFTISIWFEQWSFTSAGRRLMNCGNVSQSGKGFQMMNTNDHSGCWISFGPASAHAGNWGGTDSEYSAITLNQWHHVVFAVDFEQDNWQQWIDGVLVRDVPMNQAPLPSEIPVSFNQEFELGRKLNTFYNPDAWDGLLDDFGIWNRALDSAEVMALYIGTPPEYGCTDSTACNYDPIANSNDGSCEYGCLYCGPGTHWDAILSACVADVPSAEAAENCTLMSLQELTEGYLNLLDIVAYQDSLLTAQQGGDQSDGDGTTTNWTCGDPLPYQGYDYATVLIGNQCWFSENLRTALYANGDSISEITDNGTWAGLSSGARCDLDNDASNVAIYGRLYNWYAVNSGSGLCPSDWHVPTDGEWTDLKDYITSQGFAGTEGTALKSTSGWLEDGSGTDDLGFSALPGGARDRNSGQFSNAGYRGNWWSSSPNGGDAWNRFLRHFDSNLGRLYYNPRWGMSVRCIKD